MPFDLKDAIVQQVGSNYAQPQEPERASTKNRSLALLFSFNLLLIR